MSETRSFAVIEEKKVRERNILVVNELLAFIQNKVSEMDTMCLVEICSSNFTYNEILKAKSVLASCVTITYPKCRGSKSPVKVARRHLHHLINIFEKTDPNYFPTFVAKDFSKFLPISSINLSLKYVLEYMVTLKNEIFAIRDVVEDTEQSVHELRHIVAKVQKEIAGETNDRASLLSSASDANSEKQEEKPDPKFESWVTDVSNNRQRADASENEIDVKRDENETEDSPTIHEITHPKRKAEEFQQYACVHNLEQSQSSQTPSKLSVPDNSSADPGSSKQANSRNRRRRRRAQYTVVMPSGKKIHERVNYYQHDY